MVMQMPSWRHTAAEGLWRVGGMLQQVRGLAREEQLAHEEAKYREWQKDMKEFNLLINATSNMKPQQRANVFTTYGQKYTQSGNESMADIMGMLVRADEEDMVTAKQMSTEMAEILEDPSRDKLIQFEAKYPDIPTSLINRAWDDLRIERDERKDVAQIERERQGKIVELKKIYLDVEENTEEMWKDYTKAVSFLNIKRFLFYHVTEVKNILWKYSYPTIIPVK